MGHIIGQGQIKPVKAKVEASISVPVAKSKKELMRFLGIVGFYRQCCPNVSNNTHSLTDGLGKD